MDCRETDRQTELSGLAEHQKPDRNTLNLQKKSRKSHHSLLLGGVMNMDKST
jgi:hypothetical protein